MKKITKEEIKKEKPKLLLLVDGSNLAHRAYQKFKNLKTPQGLHTGLVYGFMRLLSGYTARFRPTHLIVTFDTKESKKSNFRNNLLGSYKEHRRDNAKKLDIDYEDFNRQLKSVKKILKYMNVPVVWDKKGLGHESDDYIAHFTFSHKGKVMIISSDKDFCQLISKRVKIYNPFKETIIQEKTCFDIMGYTPQECVDYLCLLGDKSDDIPGYMGMGPVKIRKFLTEFGSIKNFLSKPKDKFSGIDKDALEDLYSRNKVLIDLKVALKEYPLKSIPIIYSKENKINQPKLRALFKEYSLISFLTPDFINPFKKLKPWHSEKEI